jgi:hypothetical protein
MTDHCVTCGRTAPFDGCQWPDCPKNRVRTVCAIIGFWALLLAWVLFDEGAFG